MVFARLLLVSLLVLAARGQVGVATAAPGYTLPAEPADVPAWTRVAASLRAAADHFAALAREEDVRLAEANSHPIGSAKYPSNADHARSMARIYRERGAKSLARAKELEQKADGELARLQAL